MNFIGRLLTKNQPFSSRPRPLQWQPSLDSVEEDHDLENSLGEPDGPLDSSPRPVTQRKSTEGNEESPAPKRVPAFGKLRRRSSIADFNVKMAENETRQSFNFNNITFDPHSSIYYYWMAVVTTSLIYNFATVVLRIAFDETRDIKCFMLLDYVADLVYLIDIAVHYRTAYLQDGILVRDPKLMALNYQAKSEFRKNLIASFPVGFSYSFLKRFASWTFMNNLDFTRSDTLFLVVRLIRLVKYDDMVTFFSIMDSRTANPNLARAFKLSIYLTIVIHWVACFYYLMSLYEGLGINEWVYTNDEDSQYFTKKYIRCTYWSMMTLTTIGDHAAPVTDLEHVFTGLTFVVGVFVFAAVVGNVGDVISSMNAARQDFIARMDQIKFYMNHRKVNDVLQNRVKRWADYSWARTQAIDESELLQMLPDRLRTEVAISVHLETLRKVTIFEECEEGLLHELVLKLRPQIYSPCDYICRIGEIGREMYIINHGKVEILVCTPNSTQPTVVATLTAGNYFGEISLLKIDGGQNRRTADVRSVGYAELLRLSRKDLNAALIEYPDAKEILEEQARKRMKETQQVQRKTSADKTPATPADGTSEENKPKLSFKNIVEKKRSKLADVIKSDMFQKLLNNRGKEMTELKGVITELKEFDSFATKQKIMELEQKIGDLSKELRDRNSQLSSAKKRISDLECGSSVKLVNGYTHTNGETHTDPMCVDLNDLENEGLLLSQRRKRLLKRPKSNSFNGFLQHLFPNVPAANLLHNDSSSSESIGKAIEFIESGTHKHHKHRRKIDKHMKDGADDNQKGDHVHSKRHHGDVHGDKKNDHTKQPNGDIHEDKKHNRNHHHKNHKVKSLSRRWSTDGTPIKAVDVPGISINDILKQPPMTVVPLEKQNGDTHDKSNHCDKSGRTDDVKSKGSVWDRLKKPQQLGSKEKVNSAVQEVVNCNDSLLGKSEDSANQNVNQAQNSNSGEKASVWNRLKGVSGSNQNLDSHHGTEAPEGVSAWDKLLKASSGSEGESVTDILNIVLSDDSPLSDASSDVSHSSDSGSESDTESSDDSGDIDDIYIDSVD